MKKITARIHSMLANSYDCLLLVLVVAGLVYIPGYKSANMFWDENYHSTSAQRYLDGIAQFEAHPPLGKLLVAAGEALTGANAHIDKHVLLGEKHIDGDKLPKGFSMGGMRLMPVLFAVLAAGAFFVLMQALTANNLAALAFSGLYLFENAFIVHFRAVHLDSFQFFFMLMALWWFVRAWVTAARVPVRDYVWLATFIALAMMIKINAAMFLLLPPALYLREWQQGPLMTKLERLQDFAIKVAAACAAMLVIVALVFTVHTALGRKAPDVQTFAGGQDWAAMSSDYRAFLEQKGTLTPMVVVTVAIDYYHFMSKSHLGVPKLDVCKADENGSHPLHWLIMDKTINYRWDKTGDEVAYVQLAGNPVAWGLGLLAVILTVCLVLGRRVFNMPVRDMETYRLIEVFGGLYLVFMLLHLYLGSQRVMYLYHYFIGLGLSFALLALNWRYLLSVRPLLLVRSKIWLTGGFLLVVAGFFYVAPLTYHWHIGKTHCEWLNWPFSTVKCV